MNAAALSEAESASPSRTPAEQTWTFVAACGLAAVYLVVSVLIARHRLFWYDEVLTVIYSRQPSMAALWRALARGVDGMPPANDLAVRLFAHLPLALEVAARLPSALAMAAGLLVTFDCARRLTDGVHGLVAVAFLTCSTLPYYGYEARPYALFFLLSAVALWLWMNTGDGIAPALVFGGVFFVSVWVHFYTVLCLAPYTLWEFLHRATRPWPSRKLIAAYVGSLFGLALLWKEVVALYEVMANGFWSPPTVRGLALTFSDLFPHILFPLVGILGLAALWSGKETTSPLEPMQPFEQLCWFFALLPLLGFVVGLVATHAYLSRYFIALLPAFAIGFACLMWRHAPSSPRVALAAVVLFASFGLGDELEHLRNPSSVLPATGEAARMTRMLALEDEIPAGRFIVLRPGDLLTLEAHYYARHPERLVLLLGPHETEPEPQAPLSTGENRPIHYWTREELRAHASEATLIDPAPETVEELHRAGHKTSERYDGVLDVVTAD